MSRYDENVRAADGSHTGDENGSLSRRRFFVSALAVGASTAIGKRASAQSTPAQTGADL